MDWVLLLGWIVGVVMVLAGIAGAVLPILPGVPLVFAGLLIIEWVHHWSHISSLGWVVLVLLLVVGVIVDFVAGSVGAKRVGASPKAVTGAAIGSIVGLFFPPVGLLLGPFVGAVLGELAAERGFRDATNAGLAATIGLVLGAAAKIAISVAMVVIFSSDWFI